MCLFNILIHLYLYNINIPKTVFLPSSSHPSYNIYIYIYVMRIHIILFYIFPVITDTFWVRIVIFDAKVIHIIPTNNDLIYILFTKTGFSLYKSRELVFSFIYFVAIYLFIIIIIIESHPILGCLCWYSRIFLLRANASSPPPHCTYN